MNTKTQSSIPVCDKEGHNRKVSLRLNILLWWIFSASLRPLLRLLPYCCCDLTDPVFSWQTIINSSLVANSSRHKTYSIHWAKSITSQGSKDVISQAIWLEPRPSISAHIVWNMEQLLEFQFLSFSINVPDWWHSGWQQGLTRPLADVMCPESWFLQQKLVLSVNKNNFQ